MAEEQKSDDSKRRWRSTRASQLTQEILSPALRRQGFTQREIITRWKTIVGSEMAEHVLPLKISFRPGKRSDGTLVVRAESAFAPILQHRIPHILALVNQFYGYAAIADVKILQGPLPKTEVRPLNTRRTVDPEISEQVTGIIDKTRNDTLRSALQNLGEQMFQNPKK